MDTRISLKRIEEALLKHPAIAEFGFTRFHVRQMREKKKNNYYGTSVKRYSQMSGHGTTEEWGIIGTIYLNLRDIDGQDMLYRVAAEEATHLMDDKENLKEELYQYLKVMLGEGLVCNKGVERAGPEHQPTR